MVASVERGSEDECRSEQNCGLACPRVLETRTEVAETVAANTDEYESGRPPEM